MKVLLKHRDIVKACKKIGKEITKKYKDKEVVVVCVLKGAAPFHAELIKNIDLPMQTDYIQVKSYEGTESTGVITLKKDLDIDIENKNIVIVEDIVDTGNTLLWVKQTLEKRNPASITFVSMLDKPSRRKVDFKPDYTAFTIDDLFVYGFGLDLDEKCRNLKDLYVK
ncbi:MAG: hypoxanthine phosphoribosyltransferase [Clostridia bacterium]|nr:hypoxanthine phosphoribosyltransferase [Clostridia bacterium]